MQSQRRDRVTGLVGPLVLAVFIVASLAAPALAEWGVSRPQTQSLTMGTLATPTGLTAVNGACVARTSWPVNLSWTATTSTFADGYEIFRSTTAGGPYTSVATVNGQTTTTFTDTTPTYNTTYYYVVQAKRNLWRGLSSNEAAVTTPRRNCN